jgi:Sec-independent protein translocase protein TatA
MKESHMLGEIFGMDGIVVIAVLAVLVFGGAAIPKLARNLGSAKNQFEKGQAEGKKAPAVEGAHAASASASTSALVE